MKPPSLTDLLDAFWAEFSRFGHTRRVRLRILLSYRDAKASMRAGGSQSWRRHSRVIRAEAGRRKRQLRLRREGPHHCFVCNQTAHQQHHVIAVRNGGTSRRLNMVWLCMKCHLVIDPR